MNKTRFGLSANAYAGIAFLSAFISPLITLIMAGAVLLTEDNDWLKRMVLKAVTFVIITEAAVVLLGEVSVSDSTIKLLVDGNATSEVWKNASIISSSGGLLGTAIDGINGLLSYVKTGFDASGIKSFFGILGTIVVIVKSVFIILFAKKAFAGQYVKLPVFDAIVEKNV